MTEEAASINTAIDLHCDGNIVQYLASIALNFIVLEKTITKLETSGMPLREALDLVQKVKKKAFSKLW